MNTSVCLRLAFSLYDKNHNGKVDEDDLLQAISLSRKMPQLESDIACMANVMLNLKRFNSFKTRSKREQTDSIRISQQQTISEDTFTIFSPKKNEESSDGGEEEPTLTSHSKFALDKFYVFMKEREQSDKKKVSPIAPE